MKKLKLLCFTWCITHFSFAQGGWKFETNLQNEVTTYTTIYNYTGCSFVDLNGDNFVDLYAAPKTLFLNNGDGTFTQIAPLPFTVRNGVSGSSCADLDNDGDNDILVACVPSKVFFNRGDGTFADSSFRIPDFWLYGSWAVAIGDYDNTRELDFIFAHAAGYHAPSAPAPCRFFRQQASIFTPLSVALPPVTDSLYSYTNPYWSDYDLDGDMDLFMASGPVTVSGFDHCYKNLKTETGNDSLTPITTELFATEKQDGQCYNFIDYDNDGDFDLCLTNYNSAPTRMYKNNAGVYTGISTPFTNSATNISNCWGDYDHDGDLDVIITNDNQISKYYRNNSGVSFTYLPDGFKTPTATIGITNADYDNDGDLDVFTNGLGNNGSTISVGLYINDTVAGNRNFVNLKLIGTASNRSAIGAIVRLKAFINGIPVWQMREVNAQNTFQGQNDLRVHFGLGNAATIDSIMITWPSGAVDFYVNCLPNRFYQLTEGSLDMINLAVQKINSSRNFLSIFPNPAYDVLNVRIEQFNQVPALYFISNTLGEQLQSGNISTSCATIPIGELPAGVYTFTIQSLGRTASVKIVKF